MRSMVEGASQARCVGSSLPKYGAWACPLHRLRRSPSPPLRDGGGIRLRFETAAFGASYEEVVCEQPS